MNSFFERRYVIAGIFIIIIIYLLARLFYIQIIDDRYAFTPVITYDDKLSIILRRGPILDRNGKILVKTTILRYYGYPEQVKPFDTVEFCKLLGIDKADFDKRWTKAWNIRTRLHLIFEKQLISAKLTHRAGTVV